MKHNGNKLAEVSLGFLSLGLIGLVIWLIIVCNKNNKEKYCSNGRNSGNEFSYALQSGGVYGGGSVYSNYPYPGLGWVL